MTAKEQRIKDKAYRKGYADGRDETELAILSTRKQIARIYDSGETQKKSFERIDRLAEWYGVKEELEEWTE